MMKATNVLANLPKGVKGVVDFDLYINGEWVKAVNPGRMTARQMAKAAAKIAKETKGEHIRVFMYFDCLCIGEVVCTGAGVEVRIYSNETTEEPASLAWESEPKTDEELTALGVDAFGDNENANETTEFSELTHAGQCLDIYLHSTSDIYERYTVPAINAVVGAVRRNGWQLPKEEAIKNLTFWASWQDGTKKAIQAAARLVKRYGQMAPTAKDIEQVTRNYAAYIVGCAKYELETAAK